MSTRTTAWRRVLVAVLMPGLLTAWVLPASAQELEAEGGADTTTQSTDADTGDGTGEQPGTQNPVEPDPVDPDPDPVDPVDPVDPGTVEPDGTVTGAVLRWGVNHESNNRAFAPGTFNFFRAGKLPDPGRGGAVMTEAQWTGVDGNVAIEKWNGSTYQPATWAGLSTDETGTTIPSATSGRFSGHQLVFSAGTGTVDPHAGTMSLSWDGDATIVYYSGMTFFYLSDPRLEVADGQGTLTATLSGFASSMEDLTVWGPVAPREVTVATFPQASVTADGVFQATPAYAGVDNGLPEQVRTGEGWGSFPASFIAYQRDAGAASYWFSSGGSADRFKAALPVTVLVDPNMLPPAPVVPTASTTTPPTNTALTPPAAPRARSVAAAPVPPAAPAPASATPAGYQSAGDHGWMLGQVPVSDQLVWWLLAAALSTMAASTVTASAVYVRRLRPTA